MGATAARADWNHRGNGASPREAPRGWERRDGHYEQRATQVWVPGVTQQVWEPERCRPRRWGPPRCVPGFYRTVVSPGHYETRTEWVWVPHQRHRQGPAFGLQMRSPGVHVAVALPVR